jgi:NADPH2:quinone reductase
MKAAMLMAYGSPDNHKIVDVPAPEPGPGQVRIKVAYAGLRFGDFYTLAGAFTVGAQPKPPFIPGQEVTGIVDKLGDGVNGTKIGDRVASSTAQGAFAEYAVVPTIGLSFIPEKCDMGSYLVYYINLRVAYLAIYTFGYIKDGDKVLVHAPVGGVGQMIMEVLRKRFKNITIVAVTSTPEKMLRAKELGADFVINYKTSDYVKETITYLGGRKIDVSLNGVGGSTMKVDAQTIRPLGRWVIYGFTAGFESPVFSAYNSHTIIPFSILPVVTYDPVEFAKTTAFLDEWVVKETLMAPVVYPLEKIAEAEKSLQSGQSTGKIVFKI